MLRQQEKHMKKRNAEHLMGPVATVFAAGKTGSGDWSARLWITIPALNAGHVNGTVRQTS